MFVRFHDVSLIQALSIAPTAILRLKTTFASRVTQSRLAFSEVQQKESKLFETKVIIL